MTLDWWGLGLQAINVLILVWLLSRVFWRPVAGAITRRQQAAQAMLDASLSAQAKADDALAEVAKTRAGLAAEREAVLAEARATAEATTKTLLTDAQNRAEALMDAADKTIARNEALARTENAYRAASLSVEIAARLLRRLDASIVQAAFLPKLVEAIADLSDPDREALATSEGAIQIVTATEPADADKAAIEQAVGDVLSNAPALQFVTDPDLIAGLELRCAHFALHNSWRADLESIRREVEDAV
jgi:F-type H+-transporting ATPase subunit b